MSGGAPERGLREVLLAPVLAWAGLLALLAISVAYAFLPGAPLKLAAGLVIAAGKAVLIGVVFMRLNRASTLIRLTALAGVVWASLLFILALTDYLSRLGGAALS